MRDRVRPWSPPALARRADRDARRRRARRRDRLPGRPRRHRGQPHRRRGDARLPAARPAAALLRRPGDGRSTASAATSPGPCSAAGLGIDGRRRLRQHLPAGPRDVRVRSPARHRLAARASSSWPAPRGAPRASPTAARRATSPCTCPARSRWRRSACSCTPAWPTSCPSPSCSPALALLCGVLRGGARLPREPAPARRRDTRVAHRRAHRAGEPARADPRPRRRVRARRTATPHTLALFDLNGFKGYNDTFGHAAGDDLLAPARRPARRRRRRRRRRLPARAVTSSASCSTDAVEPGDPAMRRGVDALRAEGERFAVTTSAGSVVMPARGGDARRGARARRPAHVRRQGRPARVRPQRRARRADPAAAASASPTCCATCTTSPRSRARSARRLGVDTETIETTVARRRAARRRQGRDPRLDPAQARRRSTTTSGASCRSTRLIGERIVSARRGDAARRPDRPLEPRALGRRRLPRRARRRGDPARPRASCSSATPSTR